MMEAMNNEAPLRERELVGLHPLSREIPNIDAAVAEIARFSAELTLPQGTIHVISDVHGEDQKLRHIINNASGTLRPLVERLFQEHLTPKHFQELLTLIFYPAEVVGRLERTLRTPQHKRITPCGCFMNCSRSCGCWPPATVLNTPLAFFPRSTESFSPRFYTHRRLGVAREQFPIAR